MKRTPTVSLLCKFCGGAGWSKLIGWSPCGESNNEGGVLDPPGPVLLALRQSPARRRRALPAGTSVTPTCCVALFVTTLTDPVPLMTTVCEVIIQGEVSPVLHEEFDCAV